MSELIVRLFGNNWKKAKLIHYPIIWKRKPSAGANTVLQLVMVLLEFRFLWELLYKILFSSPAVIHFKEGSFLLCISNFCRVSFSEFCNVKCRKWVRVSLLISNDVKCKILVILWFFALESLLSTERNHKTLIILSVYLYFYETQRVRCNTMALTYGMAKLWSIICEWAVSNICL